LSGETLGNPANRIRFMKTILRRLRQFSQLSQRCGNGKSNRMVNWILRD